MPAVVLDRHPVSALRRGRGSQHIPALPDRMEDWPATGGDRLLIEGQLSDGRRVQVSVDGISDQLTVWAPGDPSRHYDTFTEAVAALQEHYDEMVDNPDALRDHLKLRLRARLAGRHQMDLMGWPTFPPSA